MQSYPPQEARPEPPRPQEEHDWEPTGGSTSFTCRRCGAHGYASWSSSGRIVGAGSPDCYRRVVEEVMES